MVSHRTWTRFGAPIRWSRDDQKAQAERISIEKQDFFRTVLQAICFLIKASPLQPPQESLAEWGLLKFLNSRVAFRHARRDREKFDSVVVERLKFRRVLVAIGDGITDGLLSKALAAGSTTKLPTLLPTI